MSKNHWLKWLSRNWYGILIMCSQEFKPIQWGRKNVWNQSDESGGVSGLNVRWIQRNTQRRIGHCPPTRMPPSLMPESGMEYGPVA